MPPPSAGVEAATSELRSSECTEVRCLGGTALRFWIHALFLRPEPPNFRMSMQLVHAPQSRCTLLSVSDGPASTACWRCGGCSASGSSAGGLASTACWRCGRCSASGRSSSRHSGPSPTIGCSIFGNLGRGPVALLRDLGSRASARSTSACRRASSVMPWHSTQSRSHCTTRIWSSSHPGRMPSASFHDCFSILNSCSSSESRCAISALQQDPFQPHRDVFGTGGWIVLWRRVKPR